MRAELKANIMKLKNNSGIALPSAIMFLALMSVLGAAAIEFATLEVKISARDRDAKEALYIAEAALDEYKHYIARGWGEIGETGTSTVSIITSPLPFAFDADNYIGFTLIDKNLAGHTIEGKTSTPNEIDLADSAPPGNFWIVKEIPAIGATVKWDAGPWRLEIFDAAWFLIPDPAQWSNWTLVNLSGGQKFDVLSSGSLTDYTVTPPDGIYLVTKTYPGSGPFILAYHPWLPALANGTSNNYPGDFDVSPGSEAEWNRSYALAPATNVEAIVTAQLLGDGVYSLTSWSFMGLNQRGVSCRVYNSGAVHPLLTASARQKISDWKVIADE